MTNVSKLFIAAIFGVFAAVVAPTDCKGCYPREQEITAREQIKADRSKYDRENQHMTARPWDVIRDDKLLSDRNKNK